MKLCDYVDVVKLYHHINSGLVTVRYHKKHSDLMILCYSREAMLDRVWDDVTTRCRGLIVDRSTGDIIARPFEKFFDIDTTWRPETLRENLPKECPVITEKANGSLGIIYQYKGQYGVATKSSFHSEHAEWATKWYNDNLPDIRWPTGYTPIVEIICEKIQQHAVHYGWEGLVLTALINNNTGEEYAHEELEMWAEYAGLGYVLRRHMTVERSMLANPDNEEGYVIAWERPGGPPFRVKVKTLRFLYLRKLLHDATARGVFEALRDNGEIPDDWVNNTMPHLVDKVTRWRDSITSEYNYIFVTSRSTVKHALTACTTRKEFAEYFKRNCPQFASVCFALMDEKNYDKVIWKLVESRVDLSPQSPVGKDIEELEEEE